MKRLITVLLLMVFTLGISAQGISLTQADINKLPPDMKAKITAMQSQKEVTENLATIGEWAGLGNEVGQAVNGALVALTKTAGDFSKTELGKFTMFMVAWKVMGRDMTRLIIGTFIMLFFFTFFVIKWFTTCRPKKYMTSKRWNEERKHWDQEWSIRSPDESNMIMAYLFLAVGIIASMFIFFS